MEVSENNLYERDPETGALIPVHSSDVEGEKVVCANRLFLRDPETHALIPVVKLLGVADIEPEPEPEPTPALDYSTVEQETGQKWIDGKMIYQQSYQVAGSFNIDSSGIIPLTLTGGDLNKIDKVIDFIATGTANSGANKACLGGCAQIISNTQFQIRTGATAAWAGWLAGAIVTIRYTKL